MPDISFAHLFTKSYWFSQPFPAEGWVWRFWFIFFIIFLATGIVLRVVKQRTADAPTRTALVRFSNVGLTMGFFGFVWFFFRQEYVSFLAWRFWLFLWGAVTAFWLGRIVYYLFKRAPELREEQRERQRREKYLPKKG